jgi:tetratricopeptide (TPR) repeat protein
MHDFLFVIHFGMIFPRPLLIALLTATAAFSQSAPEWKKKGDALEASGKTKDALAAYQEAEKKSPNDAAILVKIAKQYGDMMPSLKGAARKDAAAKSLEYSRKAVKANPKLSDSYLSVALSLGKSTEFYGSRQKIEASREIKSAADEALRLDRKSDYSHHMLGRWHQEMAGIGGASRLIAKLVYGGVPKGSYKEALEHFDKARKLKPKRLIHQIEYGRTLAMLGRNAEAKTEIQKGVDMPNREADDGESKVRGRETLRGL